MRHFQIVVVMSMLALLPKFVLAQSAADYPSKTVRVIVGSAPGGSADQVARILGQKLAENLKGQFVVDNRPGGGDTIATGLAAKSPADGYTLMVAAPSFTIAPSLYPSFPVDPIKDFAPVSLSTKAPLMLVVHPSLPVKSVKELIALAKAKPGALDMAITTGSNNHFATAYFASMANINVTLVPYKGSGPSVLATVGGQTPALIVVSLAAMPQVKAGQLRVLGLTTAERSSVLPDIPTIAESGVPGYDVSSWNGWVAPAGTPAAIVSKLNAALVRDVRSPDVVKRIADIGAEPAGSSPEQFGQVLAAEVPRWRKVVKDLNLRVE